MAGQTRYVIVGNGAAGTTAAETLRKLDPESSVTLIGSEPYPLYNRVALPRLLKGVVSEARVFLRDIERHQRQNIHLILGRRVEAVDPAQRLIRLDDGRDLGYTRLLVATGGTPYRLPAPGGELPEVFPFQTLDDTRAILARLETAKRAVVIGGSYIAYELAEAFRARGLEVDWLVRGPRFLRRTLEEEGGRFVTELARRHGVRMHYEEEAAEVLGRNGSVAGVRTKSGKVFDADLVGFGLGLRMNTDLLQGSGVQIENGIITDAGLRTSDPHIFAAGDIARFYDGLVGLHHSLGTWDNAISHGHVAAENMAGGNKEFNEISTYASTLFESHITSIGCTPEDRPDLEAVHLLREKEGIYRRLFLRDGRLVGAVLIGRFKGRKQLMERIRAGGGLSAEEQRTILTGD